MCDNQENFIEMNIRHLMKDTTDFSEAWAKLWNHAFQNASSQFVEAKEGKTRPQEIIAIFLRSLMTMSKAFSPEGIGGLVKGTEVFPDHFLEAIRSALDGFSLLQKNIWEKFLRIGTETKGYQFENMDSTLFQTWMQVYKKDSGQYFLTPLLGSNRVCIERFDKAMDALNIFNAKLSELMFALYQPMIESMKVLQEQFSEKDNQDEVPCSPDDFYLIWIKILENCYMILLQSKEYSSVLNQTIQAMSNFKATQEAVFHEVLRAFGIPTQSEYDELSKDLYETKRRLRALEKAIVGKPEINVDAIFSGLADDTGKDQAKTVKPSGILSEKLDPIIAATPYEIVHQVERVKLKHYQTDVRFKTPLLIVYALINRETMLDIQPGRSVVEKFLKAGIDLYMIDWGYPRRRDRFLTIDDHVNGYMDNMVDFIRGKHGIDQINLMGVCMGGTFSVMYSALHPEKIKNLVTTVTPTNFDTKEGLLHIWMRDMDVDTIVDTYGNMPGDIMNSGFLLLNPARLMIDKYVGFLENMEDKKFFENFMRMEKWIFDSPDVPGETFRQFIKDCYQANKLINNEMELNGMRVNLKNITMPLLNIYGQFDHLVPPGTCNLLTSRVGSKDTEDLCFKTGHIGTYVSSKNQCEFAPKIISWLSARDRDTPAAIRKKHITSVPAG